MTRSPGVNLSKWYTKLKQREIETGLHTPEKTQSKIQALCSLS